MVKKQILCLDDHPDTCEILQLLLSDYRVQATHSASQALYMAGTTFFDLYILDTWLPQCDGIDVCRRIRRFDANTPILFYSAAAYEKDRQAAIEAGAQEYITKPADPDFLRSKVKALILNTEFKNLQARVAEMAAVGDELQAQLSETVKTAANRLVRSKQRVLRNEAYRYFAQAGGTRAGFERFWSKIAEMEEL